MKQQKRSFSREEKIINVFLYLRTRLTSYIMDFLFHKLLVKAEYQRVSVSER